MADSNRVLTDVPTEAGGHMLREHVMVGARFRGHDEMACGHDESGLSRDDKGRGHAEQDAQ